LPHPISKGRIRTVSLSRDEGKLILSVTNANVVWGTNPRRKQNISKGSTYKNMEANCVGRAGRPFHIFEATNAKE